LENNVFGIVDARCNHGVKKKIMYVLYVRRSSVIISFAKHSDYLY